MHARPVAAGMLATAVLAALAGPCAAQEATWWLAAQCEDGRWPAHGQPGDDDLRATAWMCLGLLGARIGEPRETLAKGGRWLGGRQDGAGRLGLSTAPTWPRDHALATYAMAEVARCLAREPDAAVFAAAEYLAGHLERLRPRHADAELLLWSELAGCSLRVTAPLAARARRVSDALHAQVGRLRSGLAASDPAEGAAALLLARVRGHRITAAAWEAATGAAERESLAAVQLRAMTFLTMAAWLDGMGRWSVRLTPFLARQRAGVGEMRGSFEPPAGMSRAEATALNGVLLGLYYRYCDLTLQ